MIRPFRSTKQTRALLSALASGMGGWRYGYDLSRETGLASGTLYPQLMRLTDRGWLETKWEEPAEAGRPRRHLYRLTAQGRSIAAGLPVQDPPATVAWSAT